MVYFLELNNDNKTTETIKHSQFSNYYPGTKSALGSRHGSVINGTVSLLADLLLLLLLSSFVQPGYFV